MRKITIGFLTLAAATLSLTANAAYPEKPNHCPSMNFVIAVGFDFAVNKGGETWVARKLDAAYDTNAGWDFDLTVTANSQAEAIAKAKAALKLIPNLEGPTSTKDRAHWTCDAVVQKDSDVYVARAITPWE